MRTVVFLARQVRLGRVVIMTRTIKKVAGEVVKNVRDNMFESAKVIILACIIRLITASVEPVVTKLLTRFHVLVLAI